MYCNVNYVLLIYIYLCYVWIGNLKKKLKILPKSIEHPKIDIFIDMLFACKKKTGHAEKSLCVFFLFLSYRNDRQKHMYREKKHKKTNGQPVFYDFWFCAS